jgi:hypothetical protein
MLVVDASDFGVAPLAPRCVAFARAKRRRLLDHLSPECVRPFAGGWRAPNLIESLAAGRASNLRDPVPPSRLGDSSRPMAL